MNNQEIEVRPAKYEVQVYTVREMDGAGSGLFSGSIGGYIRVTSEYNPLKSLEEVEPYIKKQLADRFVSAQYQDMTKWRVIEIKETVIPYEQIVRGNSN